MTKFVLIVQLKIPQVSHSLFNPTAQIDIFEKSSHHMSIVHATTEQVSEYKQADIASEARPRQRIIYRSNIEEISPMLWGFKCITTTHLVSDTQYTKQHSSSSSTQIQQQNMPQKQPAKLDLLGIAVAAAPTPHQPVFSRDQKKSYSVAIYIYLQRPSGSLHLITLICQN